MAINAFCALDTTEVRDYDEGRYGVAASEMLHSHSPLVTTYAGTTEFWNLKPALGYWLLEGSFRVFGETPFALRVPAALSGLLIVALLMLYARRIAGAPVAILAGAILTTCFGFLGHHAVRSGDLDAPLALTLLPALLLAPRLDRERAARLAVGLTLGLAFLIKSFAILPFVAAVVLYGVITRGAGSWRMWPVPIVVAGLIAVTWAIARSVAEDSWEFVYRMVAEDLFQRSTSQIDPGGSSLWDYLGCLFDRCAPWPLVILAGMMFAAGSARRRFGSDRWVLLWCCALVPVVLFTIARTHHSWYIVPTYPFWAILAAGAIGDLLKRTGATQIGTTALGAAVAISLIVCEGRVISRMIVSSRMTGGQLFLQSLGEEYLPRGTPLTTAFTPDYSERFLLQAVDGFVLNDLEPSTGDGSHREPRAGWLLIRRKSNGELVLPAHWAPPRAYFGGTGYALAQIAVTGGK